MFLSVFQSFYFRFRLRNPDDLYRNIKELCGTKPNNLHLYKTALVHKSASANIDGNINNERLEYLGDAILGAIVAEFLFLNYPDKDEGFLTKIRSRIVKRKQLNQLAFNVGIDQMIIAEINHPDHIHIYGNALEALIGALYLDKGYEKTKCFIIHELINKHIDIEKLIAKESNFKSCLIEWCQKNNKEVVFESFEKYAEENSNPYFVSHVLVDEKISGKGEGKSKKEAEQKAAEEALKIIPKSEENDKLS